MDDTHLSVLNQFNIKHFNDLMVKCFISKTAFWKRSTRSKKGEKVSSLNCSPPGDINLQHSNASEPRGAAGGEGGGKEEEDDGVVGLDLLQVVTLHRLRSQRAVEGSSRCSHQD